MDSKYYEDGLMRDAQKNVDASGCFDSEDYDGLFNNCQDYASALRNEYNRLDEIRHEELNSSHNRIPLEVTSN